VAASFSGDFSSNASNNTVSSTPAGASCARCRSKTKRSPEKPAQPLSTEDKQLLFGYSPDTLVPLETFENHPYVGTRGLQPRQPYFSCLRWFGKRHGTDPTTLERQVRGDLDWIAMKAMEKNPTRRYASASEFAGDVERHLHVSLHAALRVSALTKWSF